MSIGFDPGPARNLSWRLMHSLWLLLPVVGFGCFGASALIYIGIRMSRPTVWISGIGYFAISTTLFIVIGETEAKTPLNDWSIGVWLATWVVTIVHAFTVNPSWLRWKARHVPWHAAPATPLAPPPGYPAAGFAPTAGYPAAPSGPPAGYPAWASAPATPLDVNTASAAQLATLPFLDHARALRAVGERERQGGFPDVWAFSHALGLQPHEYVRILPLVFANPVTGPRSVPPSPSTPPPSTPHHPGLPGHPGRIVDV